MKRKLQVFVSSTYEDLKNDRQAAVSAILKAGHIPAGMELFTSGDKSQMDTIRRWIDESDIYMLILGGRYGSVEPVTGVSYTELEYDYAVELEKPLFAIVIDENTLEARVKEFGTKRIELENPKLLSAFRSKVLSNISSFFNDEKDIKLCVYESLSDFTSNRDLKGWVSADEIVNSQSLLDEITRLSHENERLVLQVNNTKARLSPNSKNEVVSNDFEQLVTVLKATDVKIPDSVSSEENVVMNLFDVFTIYKEKFITGVANKSGIDDHIRFLYFNVGPKLQIHNLVVSEKVENARWRRFSVTQKGIEYLAFLEHKKLSTD
ncbi:MAG: DUF4062 domain-containing protein [Oleispira sp.]